MMLLSKVFGWLRRRTPAPLPDALWQETIAALPFLIRLDHEERQRLRMLTEAFLAEKTFSGAGGLALTDAMCVSIAAQGCLPILNLGLDYYRGWVGIIVYPDEFVIPRVIEDESGVVHEYDEVASGEAWADGPLLVSWRDVQMAGDGYNVIIHEFVHKLDMLDGVIDGIPPLPSSTSKPLKPSNKPAAPNISRQEWRQILTAAYADFCALADEAEAHGEETLFDPYAAEHPGEFFAVMSEAFFETPEILYAEFPALYGTFARFYRQDPRARQLAVLTEPCPDSSSRADRTSA